MINPTTFYEIISKQRKGPLALLARSAFRLIEFPYTWAVQSRNRAFATGKKEIHSVSVPVLSVGNLTVGGTGKTPFIQWLARFYRNHQTRVSIISRGYNSDKATGTNDEGLLLHRTLPDVPHIQNPDRVSSANIAITELETQLILLDDGFQHRKLGRDLDIVLLDATQPFGLDHVFPRGSLREPVSNIIRADVIIITRADAISATERAAIWKRIDKETQHLAEKPIRAELRFTPTKLVSQSQATLSVEQAQAQENWGVFCGIGNPAGFQKTIESMNLKTNGLKEFPDHFKYDKKSLESLIIWAKNNHCTGLICTEKDLVKIGVDQLDQLPLWSIRIEAEFLTGQEPLEEKLLTYLPDEEDPCSVVVEEMF